MTGSPTDDQLLQLIGEGDGEAFTMLWRRWSRPVLALALRTLRGDVAAAEDAAQDAFATIWRAAGTYHSGAGAVPGWVFAIAHNTARDHARRRRVTPMPEARDEVDRAPRPHDPPVSAAEIFALHGAVCDLPPRAREVIELTYYGGLSPSEIATRTGTPVGTVRTRTRNALSRLADRRASIEQPS